MEGMVGVGEASWLFFPQDCILEQEGGVNGC